MSSSQMPRRQFVKTLAAAGAGAAVPYWFSSRLPAAESKNSRPLFGAIGVGGQGTHIANRAKNYADCVAVCDVRREHAERLKKQFGGKPEIYDDYRKLLERKDIECVTVGTPDHWHTAITVAALKAGKHVYCEKPLTLTIDEGHLLIKTVKETGKVLQVGTMQRTDNGLLQFARAVATVRSGGLGKIQKVTVTLPGGVGGGPFQPKPVPDGLNWDFWQGQSPAHEYCPERCDYSFRWWYEYSGGIMTDWGAHHMDIVHWALGLDDSGPLSVDGSKTEMPKIPNGYNAPPSPIVDYIFPGDIPVHLDTGKNNGVLFEGEKGRIFVDRGKIVGKPIEEQDADKKLKDEIMAGVTKLFHGNTAKIGDHMGNFFEAWMHNLPPVSDVVSQHRAVSSCHIGNISCRLGRKLTWDAAKEEFVGDDEANAMRNRAQRSPYQFGG